MKYMKHMLRYIEDRIRRSGICLIRVPDGKRGGEWGQNQYTEDIFEEQKAENFPKLLQVPVHKIRKLRVPQRG